MVDNELSADERIQLTEHLDSSPDGWRKCAMAFINAQSLTEDLEFIAQTEICQSNRSANSAKLELPEESSHANPYNDKPSQESKRHSTVSFCMSMVLTMMFCIGGTLWWSSQIYSKTTNRGKQDDATEIAEVVQRIMENHLPSDSPSRHQTCLIKVLDNEYVSIYETPDLMPSLFLESLVLAGHQVEVQKSSEDFSRPMNRIVIKKTGKQDSLL